MAERPRQGSKSGRLESATVAPGSLISAAAFLSSTRARASVRAAELCTLAAFGPCEMEALLVRHTHNIRFVKNSMRGLRASCF